MGTETADALWNVVNGDGHHNGDGDAGVLQGGDKGGQSLGKVMDGDGQGGHHPHAHQLGCVAGVRFQRLDLMGIFLGGNALVNESDQEHPAEKAMTVLQLPHFSPSSAWSASWAWEKISIMET